MPPYSPSWHRNARKRCSLVRRIIWKRRGQGLPGLARDIALLGVHHTRPAYFETSNKRQWVSTTNKELHGDSPDPIPGPTGMVLGPVHVRRKARIRNRRKRPRYFSGVQRDEDLRQTTVGKHHIANQGTCYRCAHGCGSRLFEDGSALYQQQSAHRRPPQKDLRRHSRKTAQWHAFERHLQNSFVQQRQQFQQGVENLNKEAQDLERQRVQTLQQLLETMEQKKSSWANSSQGNHPGLSDLDAWREFIGEPSPGQVLMAAQDPASFARIMQTQLNVNASRGPVRPLRLPFSEPPVFLPAHLGLPCPVFLPLPLSRYRSCTKCCRLCKCLLTSYASAGCCCRRNSADSTVCAAPRAVSQTCYTSCTHRTWQVRRTCSCTKQHVFPCQGGSHRPQTREEGPGPPTSQGSAPIAGSCATGLPVLRGRYSSD